MIRISPIVFLVCLAFCSPASAQSVPGPCDPSTTVLCLNEGRFAVEVDWADQEGNDATVANFNGGGRGRARTVSDVWGGMWFFDPDNLDLLIHIFDNCNSGDRFWVFAGGLTNVEVTVTVTDTQSGQVRVYESPGGSPFEPITDTDAFATCTVPQSHESPKSQGHSTQSLAKAAVTEASACVESATTLCLHDGRFEVSVETAGAPSPAQKLADGTAGFPFSNPSFFDLLLTINDGSTVNGRFWVTYSMFSPLDFVLTVTDHKSGETRTYTNKFSDPIFFQDREAFSGDDVPPVDGTLQGSWFAVDHDGEGFIFDVADVGGTPTLVPFYFTYENNDSGRQAWMVGSAPIIGNKASVPVVITEGARFGAAMKPEDVNRIDWGHVKVTFLDCDTALMETASTLYPPVRYEAMRLTPAPTGVKGVCQSEQAAPMGTVIDGGYAGTWYKVERDGEGFIFNIAVINGVNTLVVFYFTYENNDSGRQAWLVGSAPIEGETADVPMVITDGARFGDAFDPADVTRTPWGNIKVTWLSCNLADIVVTSQVFEDISFQVTRLTPPTIGATGPCAPVSAAR